MCWDIEISYVQNSNLWYFMLSYVLCSFWSYLCMKNGDPYLLDVTICWCADLVDQGQPTTQQEPDAGDKCVGLGVSSSCMHA